MNPFAEILNLILPRVCHVCGNKLLRSEQFLCSDCIDKLPATGYEKYWLNSRDHNADLNPMEQRFAGQLPLDHACAPYFYTRDSSLASLVHDFKYRGFSRLAVTMGSLGAKALENSGLFNDMDLLLPIPIHWTKKRRRGYNQSEMIARGISQTTGIPVGSNLKARKPHRTQTSLSSEQRVANTKDIFSVIHPESLEGKRVLLIDDICTTGATLLSAGGALAASTNFNIRISIFTLGVV